MGGVVQTPAGGGGKESLSPDSYPTRRGRWGWSWGQGSPFSPLQHRGRWVMPFLPISVSTETAGGQLRASPGAQASTLGAEGGHRRGHKGQQRARKVGRSAWPRLCPSAGPCQAGEQPHAGRRPSGSSQQARLKPQREGQGGGPWGAWTRASRCHSPRSTRPSTWLPVSAAHVPQKGRRLA